MEWKEVERGKFERDKKDERSTSYKQRIWYSQIHKASLIVFFFPTLSKYQRISNEYETDDTFMKKV